MITGVFSVSDPNLCFYIFLGHVTRLLPPPQWLYTPRLSLICRTLDVRRARPLLRPLTHHPLTLERQLFILEYWQSTFEYRVPQECAKDIGLQMNRYRQSKYLHLIPASLYRSVKVFLLKSYHEIWFRQTGDPEDLVIPDYSHSTTRSINISIVAGRYCTDWNVPDEGS